MTFRTQAIIQIEGKTRIRQIEIEYDVRSVNGLNVVQVNKTREHMPFYGRETYIGAGWLWDAISLPATQHLDRLMLAQWAEEMRGAA